ncbi:MAG: glycogen synthase GlgA [Clostridiales bacterium]|uniref:glycogen synthase GlgA n=1 Tax=Clostridium sp. N3C TaxID=1776758 RepID=UPI00092DF46E|nr:glycogen synthase GlgA [Clostridium sp. N3C]NLZ47842.1 glycogen synthase GlgA [Clostridiales bacterium]SCN26017.1 Glycogen synthase [Clostridium sp. N3C]
MKVLFAAAEAHPFVKIGGLGDVAYALPKALRKIGIDARVILPKYWTIPEHLRNSMHTIATFNVPVGWRNQYGGLQYMEYDGVPFYFIDNEYYFRRDGVYGYFDDGERYGYFCRALLEAIKHMGDFRPDILHCNDWHTGAAIPMLYWHYGWDRIYSGIKTVFTIHNLKHQGIFPKEVLGDILGLSWDLFTEDRMKYYDCISFMKGAIAMAHKVTTVSHTYAEEIKNSYFGEGLDGLLRQRSWDLWGILNGIDTELYNPETDWGIHNYNGGNLEGKFRTKEDLQRDLNLPVNRNIPMVAMVSRLDDQKGLDLVAYVMEEILQMELQFVVLGTGNSKYENMFRHFAWKYPHKVSANIYFDNNLAKRIYAASDMFLMPSKFEPCGIGQLLALRYGSLPIVRETGGLVDTVHAYNQYTGEGNGFSFGNYNAHELLFTLQRAVHYYYDRKDVWYEMVRRAMWEDHSWHWSAHKYVELYSSIR